MFVSSCLSYTLSIFYSFVYLYFVVNFFNESKLSLAFYIAKKCEININGTKWHIVKFTKFYLLKKLIITKLLCSHKIV
jgi:hypothetical protein